MSEDVEDDGVVEESNGNGEDVDTVDGSKELNLKVHTVFESDVDGLADIIAERVMERLSHHLPGEDDDEEEEFSSAEAKRVFHAEQGRGNIEDDGDEDVEEFSKRVYPNVIQQVGRAEDDDK